MSTLGWLRFLADVRRGLAQQDAEAAERKQETCRRWCLTSDEYNAICTDSRLTSEPKERKITP